jgi:CO/xanthine dehydrogenase Mo-binding subunit
MRHSQSGYGSIDPGGDAGLTHYVCADRRHAGAPSPCRARGQYDPRRPAFGAAANHREAHPVLTGTEVTHYGQPVAFVVAESFEQARAAAYLVNWHGIGS